MNYSRSYQSNKGRCSARKARKEFFHRLRNEEPRCTAIRRAHYLFATRQQDQVKPLVTLIMDRDRVLKEILFNGFTLEDYVRIYNFPDRSFCKAGRAQMVTASYKQRAAYHSSFGDRETYPACTVSMTDQYAPAIARSSNRRSHRLAQEGCA